MIVNLQATANDASQSSKGSDEEGEDEEEEAQASDSDGDPPDTKPAYAEGSPQELADLGTKDAVNRNLQPVVETRKVEDGPKVTAQTIQSVKDLRA